MLTVKQTVSLCFGCFEFYHQKSPPAKTQIMKDLVRENPGLCFPLLCAANIFGVGDERAFTAEFQKAKNRLDFWQH